MATIGDMDIYMETGVVIWDYFEFRDSLGKNVFLLIVCLSFVGILLL